MGNVDGLHERAGVQKENLIEVHGSFESGRCDDDKCTEVLSREYLKNFLKNNQYPKCKCGKNARPNCVLFGECLPLVYDDFIDSKIVSKVDLLIIAGTSLTVSPINELPYYVPKHCMRVLFNMQIAGENDRDGFGTRKDDIFISGDCDKNFTTLLKLLKWEKDLELLKKYGKITENIEE